jgi:hypothetical protein
VSQNPFVHRPAPRSRQPDGLADVLERVLDKGLVIAGDIQLNLLDIELITIKVRLLVASADTAQQMGIDWWKHDPFLSGRDRELAQENAALRDRLARLEGALGVELSATEGEELRAALETGANEGLPDAGTQAVAEGQAEQAGPALSEPPPAVTGEGHPEVQERRPR